MFGIQQQGLLGTNRPRFGFVLLGRQSYRLTQLATGASSQHENKWVQMDAEYYGISSDYSVTQRERGNLFSLVQIQTCSTLCVNTACQLVALCDVD